MKQVSKAIDNTLVLTSGLIANNTTYKYDLTNKQLKLYIMYSDQTTPHLSTAPLRRDNLTPQGGLTVLDQSSNKGEFQITLSVADLEQFELTSLSNKNLYLALYELKTIGNITSAEMYLSIIKPDMLLEVVP